MLFEKSVSRFFFAIMLLTSLVCFDAMAGAQTASTGAMDGMVQDSSGAVIAGAKATVTNQSTGEKREATSAADGSFLVTRLAPGSYQVEVTAPGFKSSVNKGVQIVVTETLRLPVTMDLGAVNEVVQVTTAGSLAQVDETDLGRVVDQKTVVGLPLVTRNSHRCSDSRRAWCRA